MILHKQKANRGGFFLRILGILPTCRDVLVPPKEHSFQTQIVGAPRIVTRDSFVCTLGEEFCDLSVSDIKYFQWSNRG